MAIDLTYHQMDDNCPGCGAAWNGQHGAFGCGYPLADCLAMYEGAEEPNYAAAAAQGEEQDAWEDLFRAAFAPGRSHTITEAEAEILDEWEAEVFGYEDVKPDPRVVEAETQRQIEAGEIPF